MGALVKWSSMAAAPSRKAWKVSKPRAMAQDRPTADQMEYRPPTQSAKANTRAGGTPNAPVFPGAAETAAR